MKMIKRLERLKNTVNKYRVAQEFDAILQERTEGSL
jgi:hypothetical protein